MGIINVMSMIWETGGFVQVIIDVNFFMCIMNEICVKINIVCKLSKKVK
jgi:hypothetical protein